MSKKNFTSNLDALLSNPQRRPTTFQSRQSQVARSTHQQIRATIICAEETLEKIKAIAYWEYLKIKQVVGQAFEAYIKNYEVKKGPIKLAKLLQHE